MQKYILFVLSVFLLLILVIRFITYSKDIKEYQNGERISFTTTLIDDPVVSGDRQTFTVSPNGQTISVTTDSDHQYQYGQLLKISGILTRRLLTSGRIEFSLYHPAILQKTGTSILARSVTYIQHKAQTIFQAALPETESSLLLGIVFGRKQRFESSFYTNLQNTGVLHIIAASGMNTSMVGAALLFLFGLFLPRKIGILLTIAGLLFYALLAGFAASIIRATIMAIFAFGAGLFGRQYTPLLGLCLAGYLMLLVNPQVLMDVGFHLSFMATLGIIMFQPLFLPLSVMKGLSFVTGDMSTALAAQIGTLPVMLSTFGQYSLLSIPANALVLWMVPPLMILGSAALVAGMLFQPLGSFIALLCLPFLAFFEAVVNWLGGMSLSFTVTSFPFALSIGYYLLLTAVIIFARQRSRGISGSIEKKKQ